MQLRLAALEQVEEPPANLDQPLGEPQQPGVSLHPGPVEPVGGIVLGVGVVVATLRPPDLVAHQEHRDADGQEVQDEEVPDLTFAQPFDGGIVRWPFRAAIPAHVVVAAVAVLLTVGLVVFRLVRDQVVEREAVVAGHEIQAGLRVRVLVPVQVRAAEEPLHQRLHHPGIAPQERADVVAEAAIPFHPAVARELADLVEPARVPGLGDEPRAGQDRICLDIEQDRRFRDGVT